MNNLVIHLPEDHWKRTDQATQMRDCWFIRRNHSSVLPSLVLRDLEGFSASCRNTEVLVDPLMTLERYPVRILWEATGLQLAISHVSLPSRWDHRRVLSYMATRGISLAPRENPPVFPRSPPRSHSGSQNLRSHWAQKTPERPANHSSTMWRHVKDTT